MSTNARIFFENENGKEYPFTVYVHYDGYFKGGIGEDLVEFFKKRTISMGIVENERPPFNGLDDLIPRLVAFLKEKQDGNRKSFEKPGNVYIFPVENCDVDSAEWVYKIKIEKNGEDWDSERKIIMKIYEKSCEYSIIYM